MILSSEEMNSCAATTRMIIETPRPAQYSILPCPKGCSLSGFFAASLNPKTVIMELPASDRLFIPSETTEMAPAKSPEIIFETQSRIFTIIPVTPVLNPIFVLTAGFKSSSSV